MDTSYVTSSATAARVDGLPSFCLTASVERTVCGLAVLLDPTGSHDV